MISFQTPLLKQPLLMIALATGLAFFTTTPALAGDALADLVKKYADQIPKEKPEPTIEGLPAITEKPSSSGSGKYTIQISSYRNRSDAQKDVAVLVKQDHPAFLREAYINNKSWYRVNVGQFSTHAEAEEFLENNLSKEIAPNAVIKSLGKKPKKEIRIPAASSVSKSPPVTPPVSATPDSHETNEADEGGLLGNWMGLKTSLESQGIGLDLIYKYDAVQNYIGGLEQDSTSLGNLNLIAEFDLEKSLGATGLSFTFYGTHNHGGHPTEFIGDSFATSNIEATETSKIYELYFKQKVDDRFSVLLGLRDLNADYYATASSANLLNSAFGIGPSFSQTGPNGPSIYPTTALALSFKYESPNSFYFQSGVFNATAGDPEEPKGTHITTSTKNGFLYVWESGFAGETPNHKYALGGWAYSNPQPTILEEAVETQNNGFFLLIDQPLTEQISSFLKHGTASAKTNTFSSSTEVGLTFQGLIPGRSEDILSIGLAQATVSKDFEVLEGTTKEEIIGEMSYRIEASRGLSIIPDFQYVKNPGLSKEMPNAHVGTLRVEIQF